MQAGFIREVPPDEWGLVQAECLREAGFPYEVSANGDAYEYGPYSESQAADHEAAVAVCEAQYPMAEEFTQDLSIEQWERVYDHQVNEWLPCMRGLGIDLGVPPSRETFLAAPERGWVDVQLMMAGIQEAVASGELEHYNDWFRICPDQPPQEVLEP